MIQIDMPMPEACDVCPFNYDFCGCNAFWNNDEWEKYSDDWNDHVCDRETRPEYCPLKEQEEKQTPKPIVHGNMEEYWGEEEICPDCGKRWQSADIDTTRFCPGCGRAVFWE